MTRCVGMHPPRLRSMKTCGFQSISLKELAIFALKLRFQDINGLDLCRGRLSLPQQLLALPGSSGAAAQELLSPLAFARGCYGADS